LYTFAIQNQIGQQVEQAFETLLKDIGMGYGKNEYTGTDDLRCADFAYWMFSPTGL
jgi:hypothetical protein